MKTKIPFKKKRKAVEVRWVYKAKKNAKGETMTYKARLVVKDYKQHQDIHYVTKKSLIPLLKNPNFHDRNKLIKRYHFTRACIMKKEVKLNFAISHDLFLPSILILKILKG